MSRDDDSNDFYVDDFHLGYFICMARKRRFTWLNSFNFPHLNSGDVSLPLNDGRLIRSGKWSSEEEKYAERLISEFRIGNLPIRNGTSLRSFLAGALSCTPMRISKKFVHENKLGKQVYATELSMADFDHPASNSVYHQIVLLEYKFLEKISPEYDKLDPPDDSFILSKHLLDAAADAPMPDDTKRRRTDGDDMMRCFSLSSFIPPRSTAATSGGLVRISSISVDELNILTSGEPPVTSDAIDESVGLPII